MQGIKKYRLFSESPLIQSLTKCPRCVIAFRWLCHFDVGYPPPPSIQLFTQKYLFCDYNVQMSFESWGLNSNPHTMCMDIIFSKPKYRSFCNIFFLPFPKFTTPAHAPFKKSYRIYYGLIGNYPSFKMIPNTTYILFLFKKIYNR